MIPTNFLPDQKFVIKMAGNTIRRSVNGRNSSGSLSAQGDSSEPLLALGRCLQQAREQKGWSIIKLAAQLHMGEQQIEALEAGERSKLPELVFVIAQARRVAEALNVDIAALLQPLKEQASQWAPAPMPLAPAPAEPSRHQQTNRPRSSFAARRAIRKRRLVGTALVAAFVAAGAWGWQNRPKGMHRAAKATTVSTAAPKPTTPKTTPVRQTKAADMLEITAAQPSWLSVRTDQGESLFEGLIQGSRQFPLKDGLQLLAGRPDLVMVRSGESQAAALGRIDQIRWVRFKPPTP
jgi:cytoskeletal protein RodZ